MKVKAVVIGLAICLAGASTLAWGQAAKGKMKKAPKAVAAQSVGDTLKLTCADARKQVTAKNAVVIHTGANRFDRYVSSVRFCGTDDQGHVAMVRTRDNPLCFIGYTCDESSDGGAGEAGGGESGGNPGGDTN